MLVGDKDSKYVRDVKAISWELQHRLMVVNLDKKFLEKIVRKNESQKKKDEEVE